MKRNWLIYILVCSMGLNMWIIASFVYWRHGGQSELDLKPPASPLPFREMTRSLNLAPEQRQIIRGLLPEHQLRIGELRLGLAQRRQELFGILQEGAPSWPAVKDKTRKISELQGELEAEMVQFCLKFRNHLQPEQRIVFMEFMEHRLLAGRGGKGRTHGPWNPRVR